MNILPKKRWHVRTKANIERVRRDEAKAAEEEKERQRRIQLAEQEARTDFLRQKARQQPNATYKSNVVEKSNASTHVNLFQEVEVGQKSWGTNKEYEAEKKEEKEQYEQKIGVLTYLGQNSAESQIEKPWYFKPPNRDPSKADEKDEVGAKTKSFLDPLEDLKRHLGPERFSKTEKNVKKPKVEEKKSKKHKKHKKDKHVTSSGKSLDELRRERLRREREERLKTEKLLAKLKGTDQKDTTNSMDGRQAYNSQFNPHLARQSRKT